VGAQARSSILRSDGFARPVHAARLTMHLCCCSKVFLDLASVSVSREGAIGRAATCRFLRTERFVTLNDLRISKVIEVMFRNLKLRVLFDTGGINNCSGSVLVKLQPNGPHATDLKSM
jgi:hypothetical protein